MSKKEYRGVFIGTVKGLRFVTDELERMKKVLGARDGLATRIEIGPVPRYRTTPQLNYYWAGIIKECVGWCGQPPEDIHDHFKEEILRPMLERRLLEPLPNGKHLKTAPSTGMLTVEEMNEYIAACREYAEREWDVTIPDIDRVPLR